jgi:hypothetical protein
LEFNLAALALSETTCGMEILAGQGTACFSGFGVATVAEAKFD